ncbi:MAG TPA: hypothetical protein VD994_15330 [Prosthecobacter sp.]|nr:hypothetical protein [Prosthecobacter sp.]
MTPLSLRSPLLALSLAALLLPSCATMRSTSKQKIPVTTTPPGATVTVTDPTGTVVAKETTPGTLVVKRGAGYFKAAKYTATIEKPGYQTEQIPIVKDKINKWYAGNLLGTTSLALGGLIVDPATGAMYVLKPAAIDVTLTPASAKGRSRPRR